MERYVLNDKGKPVPEPDLIKWAEWMEGAGNRRLVNDKLPGGITVSTVFLGLNHNFGNGSPILWETMIFGGPHDQYQDRYSSREEAIDGHANAVNMNHNTQDQ